MCQPDDEFIVLRDFFHALKITFKSGQIIQVSVGYQAKPATGAKMMLALSQQVFTGKFIHGMAQVKGRIAQYQLRLIAAVVQQAIALVKDKIVYLPRAYLLGV